MTPGLEVWAAFIMLRGWVMDNGFIIDSLFVVLVP